jgi:hypothetical protein
VHQRRPEGEKAHITSLLSLEYGKITPETRSGLRNAFKGAGDVNGLLSIDRNPAVPASWPKGLVGNMVNGGRA